MPSYDYICHVLMVQILALKGNSLYLLDDPRNKTSFRKVSQCMTLLLPPVRNKIVLIFFLASYSTLNFLQFDMQQDKFLKS